MNNVRYEFTNFICSIAWLHEIGTRDEQQDAYYISRNDDSLLAVVCDGMGGLKDGKIASNITIQKIGELYKNLKSTDDFPTFFISTSDLLDEAVALHNRNNKEKYKCGTTIVAVAIKNKSLYWFSCGDSRLYIIRDGEIAQVTEDHNYQNKLNTLLKQGLITKEQYSLESLKGEALTSYIGKNGIDLVDINTTPFKLYNNDMLVLVSDGLYKLLNDNQILGTILSDYDSEKIPELLFKEAKKVCKGSQDNTTIIVIKYQEETNETNSMHS